MFLEYLKKQNLEYLIKPPKFFNVLAKGSFNVYTTVQRAMQRGDKIYVHPDPDCDGYVAACAWGYTFDKLGYTKYTIGILKHRVHKVEWQAIREVLEDGYKVIILVDSSTNDKELIGNICNFKFEDGSSPVLLIIDHHQSKYTFELYPSNCVIVNPKLEFEETILHDASAGVVNASICKYILYQNQIKHTPELDVMGYVSMYSDSCAVSNPIMASYMRLALGSEELPRFIQLFQNKYTSLNRSFVSFNMVPLINALARLERFDLLDTIFFHPERITNTSKFLDSIIQLKKESKLILEDLKSLVVTKESENVVIGILPSDLDEIYYNFMGLLATYLATSSSKVSLCLYKEASGKYRGSARDYLNRDILSEFEIFTEESQGHAAAFGVSIEENKLPLISEILGKASLGVKKDNIVFNYDELSSDAEINYMALYNELAVIGLPEVHVKFEITPNFTRSQNTTGTRITATSNAVKLVSFSNQLQCGSTVICKPTLNGKEVICTLKSEM